MSNLSNTSTYCVWQLSVGVGVGVVDVGVSSGVVLVGGGTVDELDSTALVVVLMEDKLEVEELLVLVEDEEVCVARAVVVPFLARVLFAAMVDTTPLGPVTVTWPVAVVAGPAYGVSILLTHAFRQIGHVPLPELLGSVHACLSLRSRFALAARDAASNWTCQLALPVSEGSPRLTKLR